MEADLGTKTCYPDRQINGSTKLRCSMHYTCGGARRCPRRSWAKQELGCTFSQDFWLGRESGGWGINLGHPQRGWDGSDGRSQPTAARGRTKAGKEGKMTRRLPHLPANLTTKLLAVGRQWNGGGTVAALRARAMSVRARALVAAAVGLGLTKGESNGGGFNSYIGGEGERWVHVPGRGQCRRA